MTSAQRGWSSTRGGTSRRHPLRQCRASRSCSSSSGEITDAAYLIRRRGPGEHPRMIEDQLTCSALIAAASRVASAGGQPGSIGVGAEFQLNGTRRRVGELRRRRVPRRRLPWLPRSATVADNTCSSIGGRFYYHVHSTAMSDFGLGGSLGILEPPAGGVAEQRSATPTVPRAGLPDPRVPRGERRDSARPDRHLDRSSSMRQSASTDRPVRPSPAAGIHYYFF